MARRDDMRRITDHEFHRRSPMPGTTTVGQARIPQCSPDAAWCRASTAARRGTRQPRSTGRLAVAGRARGTGRDDSADEQGA